MSSTVYSITLHCTLSGFPSLIWDISIFFSKNQPPFFFQKTFTSSKTMTAIVKCPVKQFLINPACPTVLFPVIASRLTRQNVELHQIVQDSIKQLMIYTKSSGLYPEQLYTCLSSCAYIKSPRDSRSEIPSWLKFRQEKIYFGFAM